MEEDGICATKIRCAVGKLAIGPDRGAKTVVDRALRYITDKEQRDAIVQRLIKEWRIVDGAVSHLV